MRVTLSSLQKWITLLLLSFSFHAFSQGKYKRVEPTQNLIEEMRKNLAKDRDMLEQYFNSSFLNRVDKFFKDSRHQLDQDADYQRMLKEFERSFQGMGSGVRTEWRDSKKGKIYVIHASLENNGKFDLKIKENKVTVSGLMKKKLGTYGTRQMSFKKSFPVPRHVDADKVEVSKPKDKSIDEIWIIFPWKKNKAPQTRPVKKSRGDKTI